MTDEREAMIRKAWDVSQPRWPGSRVWMTPMRSPDGEVEVLTFELTPDSEMTCEGVVCAVVLPAARRERLGIA